MEYDTQEAIEILARARERVDPGSTKEDRKAASIALFKALVAAAQSAGLQAAYDERMTMVWHGERKVKFDLNDGIVRVQLHDSPFMQVSSIEFDPASRTFRGKEYDGYRKTLPGEPGAKRSAVTILAELVATGLK